MLIFRFNMKNKLLDSSFYERPALIVAQELLGKSLVRRFDDREEIHMIREVEAYEGMEDKASHARFGRTKRNEVMFGPGGYIYMYLIYGIHWMLNIVVEKEGIPSAVLIRGTKQVSGPGRLSKHLQLEKSLNGKFLSIESGLWLEEGEPVSLAKIHRTPRIGVDYAEEWAQKPYRFVLPD
jgi:DNA-3-methyladenine glycosylase